MKNFKELLERDLRTYAGKFEKFTLYAPALYQALADSLDKNLTKDERLRVSAALGYFVVPNDPLPEAIHGPMGYTDDVYIAAIVLSELLEKHGANWLDDIWEQDEELPIVLSKCLKRGKTILDEMQLTEKILKYSGLG